jgi:uncharacterized membrane protein
VGKPARPNKRKPSLTVTKPPRLTTAKKNIQAIARVEQELHESRSRVERIGDRITHFFGSLQFIAAHLMVLIAWIVFNTQVFANLKPFDPYPFPLLSFIFSIEFFFLTTFVLMNQNLQSRRQEKWRHLTLQVSILTEQEVTKSMQAIHQICRRLGIEESVSDAELQDMVQETPLAELVNELEKAREPQGEIPLSSTSP